jgi:signal transduction histidine kinase
MGYMLLDGVNRRLAGTLVIERPTLGHADIRYVDRKKGLIGDRKGRALATRTSDGDLLVVVADSDPVDGSQQILFIILVIGFSASALIFTVGMLSMVRAIRLRMRAIRTAADAIVDGDLTPRLPIEGRRDEFDREAQTFNRMLDRIADLMANLKNVSDDIAHDIRMPLARIRNRLVSLGSQPHSPMVQTEIEDALAECDNLIGLFTAMLRLSEIESGARRAGFTTVDLADLLAMILATMAPAIEAEGRVLRAGDICQAEISGDRTLLSQLVINAIENAAHYTPVGATISLSLVKSADLLVLSIVDDGPGIAEDDRALALRRFGRLEASRTTPGHGLGLPLIDAIARLHRGEVRLFDARPGLAVVISFQLNSTQTGE